MISSPTRTSSTINTLSEAAGREAFATHLRPQLAKLLSAIGLDVVYSRGEGDYLYYRDESGQEQKVLDMLGGFGASLFGHNHPALVRRAMEVLETGRPFASQASARGYAGLLAERLSHLVGQTTGQSYIVTLANSGAEAVEAAIKHAELERVQRMQDIFAALKRTFKSLRLELNKGAINIPDSLYAEAERLLEVPEIADLDELEFYLLQYNQQVLSAQSRYLAIKGAFHGKTSGALKLTHNPEFRTPWHRLGIETHFIPANDEEALWHAVEEAQETYYELVLGEEGEVHLAARKWSRIVACLIEPIQGEGGIHELLRPFIAALRAAADQEKYPLIIDEIQSGMGRTGAFLASEASGIKGDYYLFSKSLGGGLAKLSAMLVQRSQYIEPFGYLHTSTFADDDFSCAIALAALDLLEADQGALMRACGEKGDYLLGKLRRLQARYPQVIKDVRGRGLMVGLELRPQLASKSSLLRVASEQNLLGFLFSGYLLNEENIRVAPTLSANNTIRLEPSAYISYADLDRFYHGLERAVEIIARAEAHRFVRFMAGRPGDATAVPTLRVDTQAVSTVVAPEFAPANSTSVGPVARKVACLAHFIAPEDLLHWDPTLAPLTAQECVRLLERADEILEPFLVSEKIIASSSGEAISLTVIGLPLTSDQIMSRLRNGQGDAVVEQIEKGVELAKQLGCTQIGFAGYTSIATNNCLALVENTIGLTSGNSLTAAAAIEATHLAAQEMGINLEAARLGIVGGVGNIGRVLAEIEADVVGSVLLAGRPGTQRRLERLAEAIYARAWQQVMHGETGQGIARAIANTNLMAHLKLGENPEAVGAIIRQALADELGPSAPIQITTDLADLRQCELIISATNSPTPIIGPDHVGPQPTVICDVSVPTDVQPSLRAQCPQVRVIKGGIMQLPLGQDLSIGGMALPDGQYYACLTEVILLGLAGIREHFSYGLLQAERVRQISQLAKQHRFSVIVRET